MSHEVNTNLIEEANEYINSGELSSTPLQGMLEADVKSGDMTGLWQHVVEARNMLREE